MAVGLQATCLANSLATKPVDWTRPGCAHLIGIGGSGMRSLARVLCQRGWSITGSDMVTDRLADVLPRGVQLWAGHDAARLSSGLDVVIHTDAVERDNPELLAAAARGIPTKSYFDVVGRLMHGSRGLAVAGTHGKSTTTAMAAWILEHAGFDPTMLCGAAMHGRSDGGRAGKSQIVLAEACEYRANFLKLCPCQAVITGIEHDHFDCYPNLTDVECAFGQFAGAIPADGLLLIHGHCRSTRRVVDGVSCCVETFGLNGSFDWTARVVDRPHGRTRFDLVYRDRILCRLESPMAGEHNLLNALAAAVLCIHQGVEPNQIADALEQFPGLGRRLEPLGLWRGAMVFDDFAHHPTELTATLKTVRQMHPDRRVCTVFQPHQISRTARLLDELADSLHNGLRCDVEQHEANRLWVAEIFRAREGRPSPNEVTSADLATRVRHRGHEVAHVHCLDEIKDDLHKHIGPADLLLLIGAGDVRRVLDGCLLDSDVVANMNNPKQS